MKESELLYFMSCLCARLKVTHKVVSIDEFNRLKILRFPSFVVFNILKRGNTDFGHWIGALFTRTSKKVSVEIFDPLGLDVKSRGIKLKHKIDRENTRPIQSNKSRLCGAFVLMWINSKINGCSTQTFLKQFSFALYKNDDAAIKFIKRIRLRCKRRSFKQISQELCCSS